MEQWNNKSIWRLLWPLIVEQLFAVTIGIADTAMVTTAGEAAISGVSIVDQINQLLIIAFSALATGGSVVVSQYIGRRDTENSIGASKQLLISNTIVSLAIMALTLLFYRLILRLVYGSIETAVMDSAKSYFWITALSMPFFAVYTSSASLFRAAGNSRLPMLIAALMNAVNIGGNALFIFEFKLGAAGAALATLLCRITGASVLFFMQFKNADAPIYPRGLLKTRLDGAMIHRILRIGVPGAVESSLFQFGKIALSRLVSGFGTASIAANAIAGVGGSLVFMPGTGFGMAILTVVGQCVGAKDYGEAKRWTFKLMRATYISLIVFNALILIFMDALLGVFGLSPETLRLTKMFLTTHSIASAFAWPLSFVLPCALRAAGDAKFVMVTAICTMWFVRISSAFIFAYALGFGALSVWLGMALDFLFRGGIFTARWLRGRWQTKQVI